MTQKKTQLSLWKRFILHSQTVHQHRSIVRRLCFSCGLYRQGLIHDLSKYSPPEFIPSVRYFQGVRSPYVYEKEIKGYSLGWLHHKGMNRHHWEYWYDVIDGRWQPIPMPERYLYEMICDRVAACRTYQKAAYTCRSPLKYYQTRNDRLYMHPETARQLEYWLNKIADEGEDAAFSEIREKVRQDRSGW